MLYERMGSVGGGGGENRGRVGMGAGQGVGRGEPWAWWQREGLDGERGRRWLHNGVGRCQGSPHRQPTVWLWAERVGAGDGRGNTCMQALA